VTGVKHCSLTILLILSLTSLSFAGVTEQQYKADLLIHKSYQLIMANYYKSISGVELLNAGLKVLFVKCGSEKPFLKNLDNEQALKDFNNVFFELTENYSGDLQNLSMDIIEAMIKSLQDKYSSMIKSGVYTELKSLLEEEIFSGFGFVFAEKDGSIYITSVFPDTPAFQAGIKEGDIIIEVDGRKIDKISLNEIYDLMNKEKDEIIYLKIQRNKVILDFSVKVQEIKLTDFIIKKNSKNSSLYIKIYFFSTDTYRKIFSELSKLNLENYSYCIIDLRDNPGGDLESAINFSKIFLPKEPVIRIENSRGHKLIYAGFSSPIVVLINNGTMSSAEIVALAFQENHRATLIGQKTSGKASIQGLFPLDEDFAIKLTVAKFFTFSGEPVDGIGIKPDIEIEGYEEQLLKAEEIIKVRSEK